MVLIFGFANVCLAEGKNKETADAVMFCAEEEVLISGVVHRLGLYPSPLADCLDRTHNCFGDQYFLLGTFVNPQINNQKTEHEIHIAIPHAKGLKASKLPIYLEEDKSYQFCARKVEYYSFVAQHRQKEAPKYLIENPSTIKKY